MTNRKIYGQDLRRLMAFLMKLNELPVSPSPEQVGSIRAEAFILWSTISAILAADGVEV